MSPGQVLKHVDFQRGLFLCMVFGVWYLRSHRHVGAIYMPSHHAVAWVLLITCFNFRIHLQTCVGEENVASCQ
jgi:hypothetical protein